MSYNKETKKWQGYVYYSECLINHKGYVGQTRRTIHLRWKQHCQKSAEKWSTTYAFDRAIKKYGKDNFTVQQIDFIIADTKEELTLKLNKSEKAYIKKYHTHITENGYNLTWGGEDREYKMLPVDVYDYFGNLLGTYESGVMASDITGASTTEIWKVCNGIQVFAKGYIFRYAGESFDKYPTRNQVLTAYINYNMRAVVQCDFDGNVLKEYPSIVKIDMADTKQKQKSIYYCCNGMYRSSFGYIWVFKDEFNGCDGYFDTRTLLKKPYNIYTANDEFVSIIKTSDDVYNIFGTKDTSGIYRVAVHQRGAKTFHGYKCFYADDPDQPDKTKIMIA